MSFIINSYRFISSALATVLNLSSTFTRSDTTITDTSGEGNDATLNSVRFAELDGVNDSIVVDLATPIAVTSGDKLYLEVTLNTGGSAETVYWHTTGVSTDVNSRNTTAASSDWVVDFDAGYDSFDASGNVTQIQIGFDGSTGYYDGKIAEIKLIDNDTTTILEHWYCSTDSDATANGLNDVILVNTKTANHGYFVGCTGGTGESVAAAQLAGMNFNKYSALKTSGYGIRFTTPSGTDNKIIFDLIYQPEDKTVLFSSSDTNLEYLFVSETSSGIPRSNVGTPTIKVNGVTCATRTAIKNAISERKIHSVEITGVNMSSWNTLDLNDYSYQFPAWCFSGMVINLKIDIGTTGSYDHHWLGYGETPWDDVIGSNDGTLLSTQNEYIVPESDDDSTVDAFGNDIETARPNNRVINLVGDGDLATVAADASLDTTKSVAFWYYHDGTANTVIDLGTPTVGSTTTALTASGFTSVTYFVDGASGSTLSTGWNHCIAVSTAALATDTIDISKRCGDVRFDPDALLVADALSLYNAQKADYGF